MTKPTGLLRFLKRRRRNERRREDPLVVFRTFFHVLTQMHAHMRETQTAPAAKR